MTSKINEFHALLVGKSAVNESVEKFQLSESAQIARTRSEWKPRLSGKELGSASHVKERNGKGIKYSNSS